MKHLLLEKAKSLQDGTCKLSIALAHPCSVFYEVLKHLLQSRKLREFELLLDLPLGKSRRLARSVDKVERFLVSVALGGKLSTWATTLFLTRLAEDEVKISSAGQNEIVLEYRDVAVLREEIRGDYHRVTLRCKPTSETLKLVEDILNVVVNNKRKKSSYAKKGAVPSSALAPHSSSSSSNIVEFVMALVAGILMLLIFLGISGMFKESVNSTTIDVLQLVAVSILGGAVAIMFGLFSRALEERDVKYILCTLSHLAKRLRLYPRYLGCRITGVDKCPLLELLSKLNL